MVAQHDLLVNPIMLLKYQKQLEDDDLHDDIP